MKIKTYGNIPFESLSILGGMTFDADLNDLIDETPLGKTSKPMYMVDIAGKKYSFPTYHAENLQFIN